MARRESDVEFTVLVSQVSSLALTVVPRDENEERWRSIDNRAADLRRQLGDLKKTFGGTFSLRDAPAADAEADRQSGESGRRGG